MSISVQQSKSTVNTAVTTSTVETISTTLNSNITNGNFLVVRGVGFINGSVAGWNATSPITDTAGLTWTQAGTTSHSTSQNRFRSTIWYASIGTKGGVSDTITLTASTVSAQLSMTVVELTGGGTWTFDTYASSQADEISGASSGSVSTTITINDSSDYILSFIEELEFVLSPSFPSTTVPTGFTNQSSAATSNTASSGSNHYSTLVGVAGGNAPGTGSQTITWTTGSNPSSVDCTIGNDCFSVHATSPTPSAPGTPTATRNATISGAIDLSWSDSDPSITSYNVTPTPSGGTGGTNPATTSTTVTGLTPGTSYTFVVSATNSSGTGPNSASSNAVVAPFYGTTNEPETTGITDKSTRLDVASRTLSNVLSTVDLPSAVKRLVPIVKETIGFVDSVGRLFNNPRSIVNPNLTESDSYSDLQTYNRPILENRSITDLYSDLQVYARPIIESISTISDRATIGNFFTKSFTETIGIADSLGRQINQVQLSLENVLIQDGVSSLAHIAHNAVTLTETVAITTAIMLGRNIIVSRDSLVTVDSLLTPNHTWTEVILNTLASPLDSSSRILGYNRAVQVSLSILDTQLRLVEGLRTIIELIGATNSLITSMVRGIFATDTLPKFVDIPIQNFITYVEGLPLIGESISFIRHRVHFISAREWLPATLDSLIKQITFNINVVQRVTTQGNENVGPGELFQESDSPQITVTH